MTAAANRSDLVSALSRRRHPDRVGQSVADAMTSDGVANPMIVLASSVISGAVFGPAFGAVPFTLYVGPKLFPIDTVAGIGRRVAGLGMGIGRRVAGVADFVTGLGCDAARVAGLAKWPPK